MVSSAFSFVVSVLAMLPFIFRLVAGEVAVFTLGRSGLEDAVLPHFLIMFTSRDLVIQVCYEGLMGCYYLRSSRDILSFLGAY